MKKGISLSVTTMVSIVLVVVVLAVMLAFNQKLFGALLSILGKFSLVEEFKIEKETKDSYYALKCAFESLSTGNACESNLINAKIVLESITGNYLAFANNNAMHKVGTFGNTEVYCNQQYTYCMIKNLELPQEIESEENAKTWISVFGDPKYVLYYEKFPQGEEMAWTSILEGENKLLGVTIAAVSGIVLSRIKIVPNKLYKGAKVNIKSKITKPTALFIGTMSKKQIKHIKKEDIAELFSEFLATKHNIEKSEAKKYLLDKEIKNLPSHLKDDILLLRKAYASYPPKTPQQRDTIRSIAQSIIVREHLSEYAKTTVKLLVESLNKVDKENKALFLKALNSKALRMASTDPYLMLLSAEMVGEVLSDDVLDETIKEGFKCSAILNNLKRVSNLPSRSVSCAALFFIAYQAVKADLQDEKYEDFGLNTFYLYAPEYTISFIAKDFGKGGKLKDTLHESSLNYAILLKKNNGEYERFYLASPCYGDLIIRKEDVKIRIEECKALKTTKKIFEGWQGQSYYNEFIKDAVLKGVAGNYIITPYNEIEGASIKDIMLNLCKYGEDYELRGKKIRDYFYIKGTINSLEDAKKLCACMGEDIIDGDRKIPYDENTCKEWGLYPSFPIIIMPENNLKRYIFMLNLPNAQEMLQHFNTSIAEALLERISEMQYEGYFNPCTPLTSVEGNVVYASGIFVETSPGRYIPLESSPEDIEFYLLAAGGTPDMVQYFLEGGDEMVTYIPHASGDHEIYVPSFVVEVKADLTKKPNFCYAGEIEPNEKMMVYGIGFAIDAVGYVLGVTAGNIVPGIGTGLIISASSAISSGVTYLLESTIEEKYKWPRNDALVEED